MAPVVSGGRAGATMPLNANALPLSLNTKTRFRAASTFPLFSSRSLSIGFKLSPPVSRSLAVVSSVLSEDRATGVSGSGTDSFKLTYLEVGFLHIGWANAKHLCCGGSKRKCCWHVLSWFCRVREIAGYGRQVDWISLLIPFSLVIWILESHGSMMLPRGFWRASR